MKTTTKTTLLVSVAGSAIAMLAATSAHAQDATTSDQANQADQTIVVTGSLIRNPNLVQANPVNVTTADAIELKQSNLAEEVLREIPGVVANIGSAVNNGNGGSSYVDLRGLGSNRNIVLLDGNRIVPGDLQGRVDLNNIPLALVSRVDAQTGAAVTTYGADAITGVINFVTKKDFAGVDLTVGDQITEKGDGNFFRSDLTIGANFDDGRGNAVLSVGYQNSDPVYQGDRDFSNVQISSYTGGANGSGTAVPARFSGTRPIDPLTGLPSTDPSVKNNGTAQLHPDTGIATNGTYAPFNFNPYNLFQTPFRRYNIFAQANYEISDSIEVYTRGLFSKNTVSTIVAPSGSFASPVTINLNNPYLPTALRQQFCAFNVSTDSAVYTPRFTTAECDAAATATGPGDPNYRTVKVNLSRRSVELGTRVSNYGTTVFDYRAGLRGHFTDHIDWDLNGSYGESENTQAIHGYLLQSRLRQGLLADGTVANPVCQDTSNGCVPINVFGEAGTITPDQAAFLTADSTTSIKTSLAQVRGVVSGDLGVSSPGASDPINFAVGGEYRKYHASQSADLLAKTPDELGGAGAASPDFKGAYEVWEAYGEIVAPLVQDKPFFKSLTVEGGLRYSSYKVAGGSSKQDTWTWKGGLSWEPSSDIKLRGNYAHAVRAPNIFELFQPLVTGLTNLGIDPCVGAAPTTNPNLAAVCIAQGAPAGVLGTIAPPSANQVNLTFGGNPNLKPEKANTWTIGAVIQPSIVPHFSMSVDYYNIKVTDVIGTPLPGDLIDACFANLTAASATNPACTVIRRDPLTGGLDGSAATTPGLFAPFSNLGKLATDGIDLTMNYSRDLGFGKLALSFVGNWTDHSRFQATPSSLNRDCAGYYSVNCSFTGSIQPKFQFSQRTTLSVGKLDVSLLWRWIDAVKFEPAQLAADIASAEASNHDGAGVLLPVADQGCPDYANTDPNGCLVEPNFRRIGAKSYFDLSARFNVSDNLVFTAAVQNLFDLKPKIVGNSIGSTTFNSGNTYPSTYDALGRRFAISAKLKF